MSNSSPPKTWIRFTYIWLAGWRGVLLECWLVLGGGERGRTAGGSMGATFPLPMCPSSYLRLPCVAPLRVCLSLITSDPVKESPTAASVWLGLCEGAGWLVPLPYSLTHSLVAHSLTHTLSLSIGLRPCLFFTHTHRALTRH